MYLLGFDIGGTKCASVLGRKTEAGLRICRRRVFPTPKGDPKSTLLTLLNDSKALCAEEAIASSAIAAVGISCGGPLDAKAGVILSPPNLPGWDRIEIVHYFEKALSCPVALQNDANACALAEWQYGAGAGTSNMVFLTFGTGLGAGLILNGQLYEGTNGMAGEIGHVRLAPEGPVGYGKAGSAEGFCSGGGIAQLARAMQSKAERDGIPTALKALSSDALTAKAVAELAEAQDACSLRVYRQSAEHLGKTLSILIDLLNPECIVIGGVYMRSHTLFLEGMTDVIEAEALPAARKVCRIVPAGLGEQIGDFGALSVAQEAHKKKEANK